MITQFCLNADINEREGRTRAVKPITDSIARAVRYNKTLRNKTSGRPKKSLVTKEKALKEILRPLWTTSTKRPRSIQFN